MATQGLDVGAMLASLGDSVHSAKATADATLEDFFKTSQMSHAAFADESAAIQESAAATADANTEIGRKKLAREAADKKAAADLGTNPDSQSYVLTSVASNILGMRQDLAERDKKIQEKLDTRFIDDPVSWLVNQFTVQGDVASYNNVVQKLNEENAILGSLQERTTAQATVNAAIDSGTSEQILASQNKATLAAAKVQMAQSQERLGQMGLSEISIRNAMNSQQLDQVFKMDSMQLTVQQYQLAVSADRRAEETLKLTKQIHQMQIDEHKMNMEERQALQEKINKATNMLGDNSMSISEYKLLTGPRKEVLESVMASQEVTGSIGYNTAASLEMANKYNAGLSPGINTVRRTLNGIVKTAVNSVTYASMKPEQRIAAEQELVDAHVRTEKANIPEENGIYSAPPLSKVIAIPAIASLPVAALLAPLAAKPDYKTSGSDVHAALSQAIEKGQMTPQVAAQQAAAMYRAIIVANNTDKQFQTLALPRQSQDSFQQSVATGNGWSGTENFNLANPQQWEASLLRTQTNRRNAKLEGQRILSTDGGAPNAGIGLR